MTYLPKELVILILSFLNKIHDKDKCLHFLFPEYKQLIYPQKKLLIEKYFNPKIIDLLGGINKMVEYPFIEHEYHFIGINDIDRIHLDDVYYPIMLGIDDLSRPYFTLRYIDYKDDNDEDDKDEEEQYIVESYFQKLIRNTFFWNYASRYRTKFLYTLMYNNKFIDREYDKIKKIMLSLDI